MILGQTQLLNFSLFTQVISTYTTPIMSLALLQAKILKDYSDPTADVVLHLNDFENTVITIRIHSYLLKAFRWAITTATDKRTVADLY
jgi:hypothetical protein